MERSTHTGIKWANSSNRTVWAGVCHCSVCVVFTVCKRGQRGHVYIGQRHRGQRQRVITDYWLTHTPLSSLFTHKPQSPWVSKLGVGYLYPQRHRAFLTHNWAIATLYSAENPVPALSISGPEAKKPATANRKIWLWETENIHHRWGGKVGSGETAGCLFKPDNVVFVYCWGL